MCNCKCQNCCNFVCSTAITVTTGTSMVITIPTMTLNNGQTLCLCLAQSFASTNEPVSVTDGNITLPLLRCDGNQVRGGQLRARRKYKLQVATTPQSLIVRSCNLCPTCYVQPQIVPAAAASAATTQEVTAAKK